ncbi:FHA domain-containing protein [Streptomyces sp. NPDC008150]|uniref:FHA domain-containing protein n=1 Tax=Streptomyces sp. NPDC008150 TaxID=3364816 RepID=UPI0036E70D6C
MRVAPIAVTTAPVVGLSTVSDPPVPPGAPQPAQVGRADAECPFCRAPVALADLVCVACLHELPADGRRGHPPEALRTTLEREATTLRLSFTSGEIVVEPGQQVVLGRDPSHTATAPRLACFDNVSRTHATVGLTADGAAWLRDENSANGTWADEVPVPAGQTRPLRDGSKVRLASNVTAQVRLRRTQGG